MARSTSTRAQLRPDWKEQLRKVRPDLFTPDGRPAWRQSLPEHILDPFRTFTVTRTEGGKEKVIARGVGPAPRDTSVTKRTPKRGAGVRIIRTKAQKAQLARRQRFHKKEEKSFKAPKSQFRKGGGAAIVKGKGSKKPTTRSEFLESLSRRQQKSKDYRKYLSRLESLRKKTGAAERRKRIDAVTIKQRIVKEIRGQPLSELGRAQKQALIDYIDRQFDPFIGRSKALFTVGSAGKIVKNLDLFVRRQSKRAVSRKFKTPAPAESKSLFSGETIGPGRDKAKESAAGVKRLKGLKSTREALAEARAELIWRKSQGPVQERFRALAALGVLGLGRGVVGVGEVIADPWGTAKNQIQALLHPKQTIKHILGELEVDPVGVVAEFYAFGKSFQIAGKGVKRSPAGRYVQEELFIRSQPKEVRGPVRKILRAARIQEKLNPLRVKSIRKVDFLEVVSLTKVESQALARALKKTDSVIFGSWSARTLGGKKLPKPKDVDLATRDVKLFNEVFMKELPKDIRKNYVIKGEKILRKPKGKSKSPPVAILDVKPLDRLIPQRSLFTGRGRIPVVGYVSRIKGLERIKKVLRINKQIKSLEKKLRKATTKKSKTKIKRSIRKLEKQRSKEIRQFSPSELAELKKIPAVGGLDFPTQKILKVKGIKMVGFGEQTVRKALGTLQVLIEKNIRRQKDPSSLLIALEVQRAALKRSKKLTLFKKRKLKGLDDAIRLLKSKAFAKLLEKKVPGLTKEYPLVSKISVSKLKKINFAKVRQEVLSRAKKGKPIPPSRREKSRSKKKAPKKKAVKPSKPRRLSGPETALLRKQANFEVDALGIKKKLSAKQKRILKKRRFDSLVKKEQQKPLSKPVKRSKVRLQKKKAVRPTPKKKAPTKKHRASKLPKKKQSRIPSSKLKRRRSSKLRPSRPSKMKSSKLKPSRIGKSKPSKLKSSKLKPSKLVTSKPSKLQPSKLRPSKVPRSRIPPGRPSKLTPSQIRCKLVRLPKGVPRPPPRLLKRPKTKKEEERLIRWVKQQKQIYRPSLAAVLFDITGVPKRKLTGFEIRPIPVFRKVKRRVKKKRKRIKRKKKIRKKR